jgi:anthranilate phosphoribosyltransferase
VAALHGGDAAANAALIERLLGGECGPPRDVVLLNAAAALVVAERAANLREGVAQAAAAIDAGHARRLLHALRTRASATGGGGFGGAKSPAQ